ncbi:MAG: sulfotransferase, partial [Verrucomicrobiota bacterium]
MDEAMGTTGLSDFGDPHFRAAMDCLIESAEADSDLHFVGRMILHRLTVRFLQNRLLLTRERKDRPHLFQTSLVPPIVVLGLPRTGTTFLHRMLSLDPVHRGIPYWELMRPISSGPPDNRRALALREGKVLAGLIPGVDRIHYSRPDSYEECIVMMSTTFVSDFFWVCLPLYGYRDWMRTHDKRTAYEEYRALLERLQSESPSRRLTLKAPGHTAEIGHLTEVFPEALVIQTHRNPVPVVNSLNSLIAEYHNMGTRRHDRPRLAEANLEWCERSI